MNKTTPEETHKLVEKLATFVMEKMPAMEEMQNKLTEYVVSGFEELNRKIDSKAERADSGKIIEMLDEQAKNINELRIEQTAISRTLDRHEKRITAIEEEIGTRE